MKRSLIIILYNIAFQLSLWQRRLFRPLHVGVKIMLIRDGQIMLVRHTYRQGWFIPGGGVKRCESLEDAARREAWEEVGAKLEEISLFGIYSHVHNSNNDHIAVFISHAFTISGQPDYEIAEAAFFPMASPPTDMDDRNYQRLQEYLHPIPQNKANLW